MRLHPYSQAAVIAALLVCGVVTAPAARAQTVDDLKQRIQELERSAAEQVDALRRIIERQEAERAKERRAQEEREQTLRALQEQVEQQHLSLQKQEEQVSPVLAGWSNFFDLNAGAEPQHYRVALVLRDVEELSNPRIAETICESVASVKSRVHRARMAL